MPGIRTAARCAAAASLTALALALPKTVAADAPVAPSSWRSLAASDDLGRFLFSERVRRHQTAPGQLEDERRPAPPADRSAWLRAWLSRYGSVVSYEYR